MSPHSTISVRIMINVATQSSGYVRYGSSKFHRYPRSRIFIPSSPTDLIHRSFSRYSYSRKTLIRRVPIEIGVSKGRRLIKRNTLRNPGSDAYAANVSIDRALSRGEASVAACGNTSAFLRSTFPAVSRVKRIISCVCNIRLSMRPVATRRKILARFCGCRWKKRAYVKRNPSA